MIGQSSFQPCNFCTKLSKRGIGHNGFWVDVNAQKLAFTKQLPFIPLKELSNCMRSEKLLENAIIFITIVAKTTLIVRHEEN